MEAAQPAPAKRARTYYGYSRNGCARCKQLRVRCDERHPECERCLRAGTSCPGFTQRLRWSSKHEKFSQPAKPAPKPRRKPTESVPPSVDSTLSLSSMDPVDPISIVDPSVDVSSPALGAMWTSLFAQCFPMSPGGRDLFLDLAEPLPEQIGTTEFDSLLASPDAVVPFSPVDLSADLPALDPPRPTCTTVYLPSPPAALQDVASGLVEFYFKETARLFSCFDSRMNPFRTAVVRVWSSSRLIYCTLQSMAAACLVSDFPHLGPVGRRLRREAVELLSAKTTLDLHAVLAMLMLGGTSSWHDTTDLALPCFNYLVRRLSAVPPTSMTAAFAELGDGSDGSDGSEDTASSGSATNVDQRNHRFFYESMLYWEMLLAFVADSGSTSTATADDDAPFPSNKAAASTTATPLAHLQHPPQAEGPAPPQRVPHPWTGFAADTQRAVQQVGRLVRQQRKTANARVFPSAAAIRRLQRDMQTAQQLEARLVAIEHPAEQAVADTGDRDTPVWHLLALAEVIRAVGLVQLYHVFPDLLSARLEREGGSDAGDSGTEADAKNRAHWLTAYALRTLDLLRSLPAESGTRDFQPFMLVALSSELRVAARPPDARADDIDLQSVEIMRARGFVRGRLTAFLHSLPPRPMAVCLQIVEATWRRMDGQTADGNVYWMDVMMENGWETIMA